MDPITCMQSRLTLTPRECTARQEALDREGIPEHPECGECALGQQVRDELEEAAVADALGGEEQEHDVDAAPEAPVAGAPSLPSEPALPAAALHYPEEPMPKPATKTTTARLCAGGCNRRLRSDSVGEKCSFCRGGKWDPKKTPAHAAAVKAVAERKTPTAGLPVKTTTQAPAYPTPRDLVADLSDQDLIACARTRHDAYRLALAELDRRVAAKRELEQALVALGQPAASAA